MASMSKDVLGGADFHRENNVIVRMVNNEIDIGDACTVESISSLACREDKLMQKEVLASGDPRTFPVLEDII